MYLYIPNVATNNVVVYVSFIFLCALTAHQNALHSHYVQCKHNICVQSLQEMLRKARQQHNSKATQFTQNSHFSKKNWLPRVGFEPTTIHVYSYSCKYSCKCNYMYMYMYMYIVCIPAEICTQRLTILCIRNGYGHEY